MSRNRNGVTARLKKCVHKINNTGQFSHTAMLLCCLVIIGNADTAMSRAGQDNHSRTLGADFSN